MPLSSLIFVVILAVWAVYLVQHYVRRRDHLATARSVDRFSESMRVLERRRALPRPDLSEPAPRSYTLSPLRPARPQVVVKHVPAGELSIKAPAGATAVKASASARRARTAARLRAGGLLLGSVTMVTLVALSLAKQLPPWSALVGVGVMAACVSVARLTATRGRRQAPSTARRSAPTRGAAPAARSSAAARSTPAAARSTSAATSSATSPSTLADLEPAEPQHAFARQTVAMTTRPTRRTVPAAQLYDIDQVEIDQVEIDHAGTDAAQDTSAHAPAAQAAAPGSWDPVPVPPPTYTLKAKAYRPAPVDATAPSLSAPADGTQLPADGNQMALEEEFEELPRIEWVG